MNQNNLVCICVGYTVNIFMWSVLGFYNDKNCESSQKNWHIGPLTSKLQLELVNFLQAVVSQSVLHLWKVGGVAHQEEESELAASERFCFHAGVCGSTHWVLWRWWWCCATCLSRGPELWPVWSSHHPHWCWTASPDPCAGRWSTCRGGGTFKHPEPQLLVVCLLV